MLHTQCVPVAYPHNPRPPAHPPTLLRHSARIPVHQQPQAPVTSSRVSMNRTARHALPGSPCTNRWIKIHLDFARDVCTHTISGKEYETVCRRFLTLTRRCETLVVIESRLVLVLATDGAEYFKDHPHYAGGAHSSPLIGVISLDPKPAVASVGADIQEKWDSWIQKHPTT